MDIKNFVQKTLIPVIASAAISAALSGGGVHAEEAAPSSCTLNAGQYAVISAGYLPHDVKVMSTGLSTQTDGTATGADILSGKTAWVNGKKLTGAMPSAIFGYHTIHQAEQGTAVEDNDDISLNQYILSPGNGAPFGVNNTVTISTGYNYYAKTITVEPHKRTYFTDYVYPYEQDDKIAWEGEGDDKKLLLDLGERHLYRKVDLTKVYKSAYKNGRDDTYGTAAAADIREGKTAWVNGNKVAGTMPDANVFYTMTKIVDIVNNGIQEVSRNGPESPEKTKKYGVAKDKEFMLNPAYQNNYVEIQPGYNIVDRTIKVSPHYVYKKLTDEDISGEGSYTKIDLGAYHAVRYIDASKVYEAGLRAQTEGTAKTEDILEGKTAWVNGEQVTGTMRYNKDLKIENLRPGDKQMIPWGYIATNAYVTGVDYSDKAVQIEAKDDNDYSKIDIQTEPLGVPYRYVDASKVYKAAYDAGYRAGRDAGRE